MANLSILDDKTTIIFIFLVPCVHIVRLGLGLGFLVLLLVLGLDLGLGLGLGSLLLWYVYAFYEKSHSVLLCNLTARHRCNLYLRGFPFTNNFYPVSSVEVNLVKGQD